jgi:hypothetical protein
MALRNLGRTRHRTQFWLAAAFGFVLMVGNTGQLNAQQAASIMTEAGNVAVTGFSGSLPPVQIAPRVDPNLKIFIDLNGPFFGLAVYQHRLYYAVADGLQVWSVWRERRWRVRRRRNRTGRAASVWPDRNLQDHLR